MKLVTRLHIPSRQTQVLGLHRDAEGARHMVNADVVKCSRAYSDAKAKDPNSCEGLSLEDFEWSVDDHPVHGDEGVVYVVQYAIPYEGCSLCGVFESKEEAIRAAQKIGRNASDDIEVRACGLNYAHKIYAFEEKPLVPFNDWTPP